MCKNTLVFTPVALSTYELYRTNVTIWEVVWPIERWHSWQSKLNRSSKESIDFWVTLTVDKGLGQVNEILAKMNYMGLFGKVRLYTEGCDAGLLKLDIEDPNIIDQDETAHLIGVLSIALAARRLRSCAWYLRYPGSFLAFLDEGHSERVLAGFKQVMEDHEHTSALTSAHWIRMCKRSPLTWSKVKHVIDMARSADL